MRFENSIWRYFHESSRDKTKGHPPIAYNANLWPESWKVVQYKTYDRLPKIILPKPEGSAVALIDAIKARKSSREFLNEPLPLIQLSELLFWSCSTKASLGQRPYPSGGARFPIEVYVVNLQDSEEIKSGVYHYDFQNHVLDALWEKKFDREELEQMFGYPWAKQASLAIVMTGVFDRTIEKYGERGYRFVLLEAGHIGQNIALVSAALDLKCCSLGGVNEEHFESLIDMDTKQESVVYSLVIGG